MTTYEERVEAAARVSFEPDGPGGQYTWAEMVTEDPSRADIWREDARKILDAAGVPGLIEELKTLRNVAKDYDTNFPCDGGCNIHAGPEEECSRHGRSPRDLWGIISGLIEERDAEKARADHLESRLRHRERLGLAAIFLADTFESDDPDGELRAMRDEWLAEQTAPLRARVEVLEAAIREALDVTLSTSVPLGMSTAGHFDRILDETCRILVAALGPDPLRGRRLEDFNLDDPDDELADTSRKFGKQRAYPGLSGHSYLLEKLESNEPTEGEQESR